MKGLVFSLLLVALMVSGVSVAVISKVNGQDFTLPVVGPNGLTGEKISLSQFRGEVVLLEFTEPWCSHCQNMAPIMEQLYNKYGSNVVFISVSGPWNGATADDTAKFIRDYGSGWTYLYDSSGNVMSAYGITAVPTFLIIGGNGSILTTYPGEVSYDTLAADLTRYQYVTQTQQIETRQIVTQQVNSVVMTPLTVYTTWLEYTALVLVICGVIGVAVWKDANSLGEKNAPLWALGTFLVLIVVLPVYLIFRSKGMIGHPKETSRQQEVTTEEAKLVALPSTTMFCPECGKTIPRSSKFCKECGARLS